MAPALPPRGGMPRILVMLLAATALTGMAAPATAQEALKGGRFGEWAAGDRGPTPFLGSLAGGSGVSTGLRVNKDAMRMVGVAQPARLSFSTSTITDIPGR